MTQEQPRETHHRIATGGKLAHPTRRGHYSRPTRLPTLVIELATAGTNGLTLDEILYRPSLRSLYNERESAAKQALYDDLRTLCGGSMRKPRLKEQKADGDVSDHIHRTNAPPLVECDRASKRYRLARPLPSLHLSPNALDALYTLAHGMRGGQAFPGGQELFAALTAALPDQQQALLDQHAHSVLTLELGPLHGDTIDTAILQQILRAASQRQCIDFSYHPLGKSEDKSTPHHGDEVLEVRIAEHAYATVWCEEAQRELDLRLDRFISGSVRLNPNRARGRRRRQPTIRYWLAAEIASGGVSKRLEGQTVEMQSDGSAIVTGAARSLFWAQKLLLGYGASARALEPPALVAAMRQTIERMRARYAEG